MSFNVPINKADIVVLIVLFILLSLGFRALISFFKTPKKKSTEDFAVNAEADLESEMSSES